MALDGWARKRSARSAKSTVVGRRESMRENVLVLLRSRGIRVG